MLGIGELNNHPVLMLGMGLSCSVSFSFCRMFWMYGSVMSKGISSALHCMDGLRWICFCVSWKVQGCSDGRGSVALQCQLTKGWRKRDGVS